jgi:hypothetical protein
MSSENEKFQQSILAIIAQQNKRIDGLEAQSSASSGLVNPSIALEYLRRRRGFGLA